MLQDRFGKSGNNNSGQQNPASRTWQKLKKAGAPADPNEVPTYVAPEMNEEEVAEMLGVSTGSMSITSDTSETLTDNPFMSSTGSFTTAGGGEIQTVALPQIGNREHEFVGQIINNNYLIDSLIAEGGMGQVFLATHMTRNIPVVLKLMKADAKPDDIPFQRFVLECKVTTRLRHPNLVSVLDWGILVGSLRPYLVMQFVEGESMRKLMRKEKQFSPLQAAQMLVQVCAGLEEVHAKEVIHRDMKPENLMVRGDYSMPDNVKILDFGIVQLNSGTGVLEEEGMAIGSVGYMSPEQICGNALDARSDIYSLGVIFYELICGKGPFAGLSMKNTMRAHVKEQFTAPSGVVENLSDHAWVDRICARAMAKSPEARYQTAAEFRKDLEFLIELNSDD